MQAPDFAQIFIQPFETSGFSYFVTGSIASMLYGEPRLTHDIDMVVHIPRNGVSTLVRLFPEDRFYCPPAEVVLEEISRPSRGQFNIIHHETGLKADIYTFGSDPLHRWALEKRSRITIEEGMDIWVSPPEYVIIKKLQFYREGGSEKHISDIKGILLQRADLLDMDFIQEEVAESGLQAEWKKCRG